MKTKTELKKMLKEVESDKLLFEDIASFNTDPLTAAIQMRLRGESRLLRRILEMEQIQYPIKQEKK